MHLRFFTNTKKERLLQLIVQKLTFLKLISTSSMSRLMKTNNQKIRLRHTTLGDRLDQHRSRSVKIWENQLLLSKRYLMEVRKEIEGMFYLKMIRLKQIVNNHKLQERKERNWKTKWIIFTYRLHLLNLG